MLVLISLCFFFFSFSCFTRTCSLFSGQSYDGWMIQGERNLENVTHEEAVATLKSITDKVTLVVGKTNLGLNNSNSIGLSNSNSQSTSAVNSVGQNVVDYARSQSPSAVVAVAAANSSSRSHSPRNILLPHFIILVLPLLFCPHYFYRMMNFIFWF